MDILSVYICMCIHALCILQIPYSADKSNILLLLPGFDLISAV